MSNIHKCHFNFTTVTTSVPRVEEESDVAFVIQPNKLWTFLTLKDITRVPLHVENLLRLHIEDQAVRDASLYQ